METGAWKQVFGEHGSVSFLRPGKNWHFVCFQTVEEAGRARDALDGTDGAVLVGRCGLKMGAGSWLAQHSEGLKVMSTEATEEVGETVIRIDWAVPQNVQHPLFDEMRDLQDRINPGWQQTKSGPESLKSQKARARRDRSNKTAARAHENRNTIVSGRQTMFGRQSTSSAVGSGNILEQLLMSSEVPTCPVPSATAPINVDEDVHVLTLAEEFDGTRFPFTALASVPPNIVPPTNVDDSEPASPEVEAKWRKGQVSRADFEIPVVELTAAQRKNQKRFLLKRLRKIDAMKEALFNGTVLESALEDEQLNLRSQEDRYRNKLAEHKNAEISENIGDRVTATTRPDNSMTMAHKMRHMDAATGSGPRRKFGTAIARSSGGYRSSMLHTVAVSTSDEDELKTKEAAVMHALQAQDPASALELFNKLVVLPSTRDCREDAVLGDVRGQIDVCNALLKGLIENGQVKTAIKVFGRMSNSGIGRDRAFRSLKKKNNFSEKRRNGDIYLARPNADTYNIMLNGLSHEMGRRQRDKNTDYPADQVLHDLLQAEYVFQQARKSMKGEATLPVKTEEAKRKKKKKKKKTASTDSDAYASEQSRGRPWTERVSEHMAQDKKANRRRKWKSMNAEQAKVVATWERRAGNFSSMYISMLRCCHAARDPLLAGAYFDDMRSSDANVVDSDGISQARRELEIFFPGLLEHEQLGSTERNMTTGGPSYANRIHKASRDFDITRARRLFQEMRSTVVVGEGAPENAWVAIIRAELCHGNREHAYDLFEQFRGEMPQHLSVWAYRSILTDWFDAGPKSEFLDGGDSDPHRFGTHWEDNDFGCMDAVNRGLDIFDLMYNDYTAGRLQDSSARQPQSIDYAIVLDGLAKAITFMTPPPIVEMENVGGATAWLELASASVLEHAERIYGEMLLEDSSAWMEGDVLLAMVKCCCLARRPELGEDYLNRMLTEVEGQLSVMKRATLQESLRVHQAHVNKCVALLGNGASTQVLRKQHERTLKLVFNIPPEGYLCRNCFTPGHYHRHCPRPLVSAEERGLMGPTDEFCLDPDGLSHHMANRQRQRRHFFSLSEMESLSQQGPGKLVLALRSLCTGVPMHRRREGAVQAPDPHAAVELLKAMCLHFPRSVTIDHANDLLLNLCNVGDFQRASRLFNAITSVDHKLDNYYLRKGDTVGMKIPSAGDYFEARESAPTVTPSSSSFTQGALNLEANLKTYTILIGSLLDKEKKQWNDPLRHAQKNGVSLREDGYSKITSLGEEMELRADSAIELFESMKQQGFEIDQAAYGTFLQGLCRSGRFKLARHLFESEMAPKGMCDARANQSIIGYLCSRALALKQAYVDAFERGDFDEAEAELENAGKILSFAVQVFDSLDKMHTHRAEVLKKAQDDDTMSPIRKLINQSIKGFDIEHPRRSASAPRASPRASEYFCDTYVPASAASTASAKDTASASSHDSKPNKDAEMYIVLSRALLRLGDISGARAVYEQSLHVLGESRDLAVASSYVRELCRLHRDGTIAMNKEARAQLAEDALKMLSELQRSASGVGAMLHRDSLDQKRFVDLFCTPYSAVVASLCLVGRSGEARVVFDDLKRIAEKFHAEGISVSLDTRAYNTLIRGLCYDMWNNAELVGDLYLEMRSKGFDLSPKLWTLLVKALLDSVGKRGCTHDLHVIDKVWSLVEDRRRSEYGLGKYQYRVLMRGFGAMKDPTLVMSRMRLLSAWMDQDGVSLEEWDQENDQWCAAPQQQKLDGRRPHGEYEEYDDGLSNSRLLD